MWSTYLKEARIRLTTIEANQKKMYALIKRCVELLEAKKQ